MAVTSTQAAGGRAWSIGPLKIELWDVTIASGDTSVVITSLNLNTIVWSAIAGLSVSAKSTSAGVVTFTVADPVATRLATVIVVGI